MSPDTLQIPLIAGSISSMLFILGNLPMVSKALRSKDLHSYSCGNIMLSKIGNAIYWIYQAGLPFDPAWFLHGFNTLVAFLMLILYLRYEPGCVRQLPSS